MTTLISLLKENPSKFLDTKITVNNGKAHTSVFRKPNKFPAHWSSKIPKRYKRNTVNGDLSRAYNIAQDFEKEKDEIRSKFKKAGYPVRFTESVINQFQNKINTRNDNVDDIIEESPPIGLLELPFVSRMK